MHLSLSAFKVLTAKNPYRTSQISSTAIRIDQYLQQGIHEVYEVCSCGR